MDILKEIKKVAPNIAVSVSKERDPHFVWDGDGPKPKGYQAYDVTVCVQVIVNGILMKEESHLGGCYYRHNEKIGDIHGYLPQMIEEAINELESRIKEECDDFIDSSASLKRAQIKRAQIFLKNEMKRRWEVQQKRPLTDIQKQPGTSI